MDEEKRVNVSPDMMEKAEQTEQTVVQGACEQQVIRTFFEPNQVFTFDVSADGTLIVDTLDCCEPGDRWGVRIVDPDRRCVIAEACGTGSIDEFSGEARAANAQGVIVEVFYCEGVDLFPAGMTIRFRCTGTELTVVPTGACESETKSCTGILNPCPARARGIAFD